ncbi:MAG: hypothetical protein ABW164_05805 [Sphingobium sp.]
MDGMTGSHGHERRMEPRHPSRREAVLYCNAVGEPVVVTNISSYGAMLAGRSFPSVGTYVTLAVAGQDLVATVAWCGEEKCGLLFHERVDPTGLVEPQAQAERRAGRPHSPTYI